MLASEKNDKNGIRDAGVTDRRSARCGSAMYASAINSGKNAQFSAVMLSAAFSEMLNLLSELDFSSYTIKTLLKSDVQPVQVVGPS
ncbi:hypothetical protein [Cupriavidus necator]|uniref:hypothetical protein n=1 Tax=Cupriavidus necator TaxID=106590 RepID=UPI002787226E|nr:hypothetical protein [Cupriavidus necator]MDQ0142569.1 hypothetical protein [Cupriavidus necator]